MMAITMVMVMVMAMVIAQMVVVGSNLGTIIVIAIKVPVT
jgi:hypothetical protein